jgi:serine/threonine protein kinase/tetratricopeptide (TPR) repeat protein
MSSLEITEDSSLDRSPDEASPIDGGLPSVLFKGFELGDVSGDSPGAPWDASRRSAAGDDGLESLLRGGQWLGSEESVRVRTASSGKLPRAGDEVMGFRLTRELGRGAFARVFLAEQTALAGRRVAVKISRADRDESQTLAQLQHTHIVPIYSTHVDPANGLRMLVMPYFGGTTLDRLLAKAGMKADRHVTGRSLVTALDDLSLADFASRPGPSAGSMNSQPALPSNATALPSHGTSQAGSPWLASRLFGRAFLGSWRDPSSARHIGKPARHILARSSYIQAVTWIAARLADGLAHAHHHGILHRDIKPSNVLVASDGQPMLLDFNLARDVKSQDPGAVAYVGGTLPYMAPEHLDAFNVQNPTPATAVDERSDIYSLGVVLFEMLTNKHPFPMEPPGVSLPAMLDRMAADRRTKAPSPRDANPAVPQSLAAIVTRCLEPDPMRRYPDAAQLAEDLQCELDNLPLEHTPEPSVGERARKWMRRHPRLSSGGSIAAISALAIVALAGIVLTVGGRLAGYDAERRWIKFEEGLLRAQLLVHTGSEPGQNLADGQQACEQTLELFDVLTSDGWRQSSRVKRLDPKHQAKLADDAMELVILLARVRAEQSKLAAPARNQTALLENAVELLDRAAHFQAGAVPRALYEDRSDYRRLLGDTAGADADWQRAEATPVRTARDLYLRATSLAAAKNYEAATRDLETAVRLDPKHFWARFELGICHYQLGQFAEAIGDYDCCETLWDECTWVYLNRGLAASRLGRWDDAIADYTRAIGIDAAFADAYVNRGLAYLNHPTRRQFDDSIADLTRAIDLGRRRGSIWAARAAAHAGRGGFDQAQADYVDALRATPGDDSILFSRGFALARHAPEQALADFDALVVRHPDSARAHFGRAIVLSELPGRAEAAIAAARRAVAAEPRSVNYQCSLAVLLARAANSAEATQLINEVLETNSTGLVHYQAACVFALASRHDPRHADRSLDSLEKALTQDYGREVLATDPDLDPIRADPRFAKMLTRVNAE